MLKHLRRFHEDEGGVTGLETAIILIAFVIVASVFAFVVLSTGLFSAERGKDTIFAGLERARANLEVRGAVTVADSNASGTITSIAGVLENIGGIETTGIDVNFDVRTAETGIGRFRFQWMTSLLLDYDDLFLNTAGSFDRVSRKGTERGSPARGFFETKSTLNTDWYWNDWSVRLGLRYLSSLTEECTGLVEDFGQTQFCSGDPDTNTLDSVIYADTQVSWRPSAFQDGNWTFTVGVNNLFDEGPPICFSCDLNSLDGTSYPIGGQFWYLRANFEL